MAWHAEPLVGFDLETTGTEPLEARIVTAAIVEVGPRGVARRTWLADPGVRIPPQASAIHGISSERAAAEGRPAREVADEIAEALTGCWRRGVPVVAYNAAFDLTLLSAELRRHGLPSLAERGYATAGTGPVIDPYTIDRAVDRYRKGKRTLEAVCAEYGIRLDDAHEAGADALAAVRVARAIAGRHKAVAALTPAELHERQIHWYAQWASDFQRFLRRKGDAGAVVDPSWPLRALPPSPAAPPLPEPGLRPGPRVSDSAGLRPGAPAGGV
ncbi:3'-5' exonuclease [Streptomyces sp. HNM0663]|uniref:3'-5' exonuclease n=1 Tax=Streptomyces chengmaiensis TaxID=3040919 RepID=A0ABT6HQS0_9ACTN|nr:3'-5' exonuclease [Streptomyces chengmaiensis]MDH2391058.1 3'-5' exonuclease [Streptomyces chengmaiensis]